METPDAKTLNLADVLSGQEYPEVQVRVYLNPAISYEVGTVLGEIEKANKAGLPVEDLEAKLDDLEKKGQEHSMTVHVTGAPRHDRQIIAQELLEEFPVVTDAFGRPKPNPKADQAYADRLWALHVKKMVHASGAELNNPSEADVALFRQQAPEPAVAAVEKAMASLSEGIQSGFEALVQRHDFLSQP